MGTDPVNAFYNAALNPTDVKKPKANALTHRDEYVGIGATEASQKRKPQRLFTHSV
jgi:hypothetical protein